MSIHAVFDACTHLETTNIAADAIRQYVAMVLKADLPIHQKTTTAIFLQNQLKPTDNKKSGTVTTLQITL